MAERILGAPGPRQLRTFLRKEERGERLSAAELARIQATVEQLSLWMDSKFEVPLLGWRFGLDALIGLIPGLGDAATTMVSLYILTLASRAGLPKITLARMGLNVGIDFVLGSVPLVGDLFDMFWKANQMNAALLRQRITHADFHARRGTLRDWLFVGAMVVMLFVLFAGLLAITALVATALWNAASGLLHGSH